MSKIKLVIVYPCPYCSNLVYFNNPQNLTFHIYKNHLKQALNLLTSKCKEYATKKNMKWCLT